MRGSTAICDHLTSTSVTTRSLRSQVIGQIVCKIEGKVE
jgi:hypothetical protein